MTITREIVDTFLNGHDPMEHIVSIECAYDEDRVSIIYVNEKGEKRIKLDDFKPFAWVKHSAAIRMFEGKRGTLKRRLNEYGISIKLLRTKNDKGETSDRLENGYKYLFYAKRRMAYRTFLMFFQEAGTPVYSKNKDEKNEEFMVCYPVEQYMMETGKRMFKGYANYDDLKRMSFDIETQGLDPRICRIEQIGVRTNQGFEKVIAVEGDTKEELDKSELQAMDEFLRIIATEKPDTIFGHNTENFDWNFFIVRCQVLGTTFEEMSMRYFKHPIYKKKKESILKLGGEMETFFPTIVWGHNVLDSLHAVRRAQALNSDIESANLKYITRYLDLKKPNRVYVPGNKISTIWHVMDENFAFNNTNGDWYEITEKNPLKEGYEKKSGHYIVERYLLDDIWEADKVELALNGSNFALAKMLPTSFSRVCTMGTAGIWKLIMQAWSFENDLAIPAMVPKRRFTGGLSRLIKTGYVTRLCKNDYNSLYPSIVLTWNIQTPLDITNIMLHLLNHILTERERLKGIKAEYGEKSKATKKEISELRKQGKDTSELQTRLQHELAIRQSADSQQLAMKVIGNSFFGSYGCSNLFPWGDCDAAENVTCIGRQSLRLMIGHFQKLGYDAIVGDSFTSDTPVFIKYDDDYPIYKYRGLIDIRPISDIFDSENTEIDILNREYGMSDKHFKVLCRNGWIKPTYIYRHKTDKQIFRVNDGKSSIDVTEDHSLFNDRKEKIKPTDINESTKLEYSDNRFWNNAVTKCSEERIRFYQDAIKKGGINKLPITILNAGSDVKKAFLKGLSIPNGASKTLIAGINYISN